MSKKYSKLNAEPIFVPLGEFDEKRLYLDEPATKKYSTGNTTILSNVGYTTEKGSKNRPKGGSPVFFELPESFCFGVNGNYKFGISQEEQTTENLEGLQICYNLTSMDTIDDPTDDEIYVKNLLDSLYNEAFKKVKEECEKPKSKRIAPQLTVSAYNQSKMDNDGKVDPDEVLKPLYSFPNKKLENGDTIPDTEKPARSYIKLITYGKGRKLDCKTSIYGPGDRLDKTGLKYLDVMGTVKPVVTIEDMYWGSHMKKPWGVSIRMKVHEMNFIPQSSAPTKRFLTSNKAPAEEFSDESNDDNSKHDSDSDDSNDFFENVVGQDSEDDGNLDDTEDPVLLEDEKESKPKKGKSKKPKISKKKKPKTSKKKTKSKK